MGHREHPRPWCVLPQRTYTVLFVPVQLAAGGTGTLVAAGRVDAAKFAAPPVDAAFIYICREEGRGGG